MKKKWLVLLILAVAVAALFLPAAGLHVHAQLGAETAALFPESLSLWDVISRGASALPVDQVPALSVLHLGRLPLLLGMIAMICSALTAFLRRKGMAQLSLILACLSAALLGAGTMQWLNIEDSLLFTVLISAKAWAYVPLAAAVVLAVYSLVALKGAEPVLTDDKKLRLVSACLAIAALLVMLLPAYVISVPDTITANPADASAMNRSVSQYSLILGKESNLYEQGQEKGAYADILTGDLAQLEPYSADANNIRGVFVIRNNNTALNAALLAAAILLLLSAVLALIPRVDRWFPLAAGALGAVLLCTGTLSILSVGDADMYSSASRQLLHLGLGTITPIPLLAALLAVFSAAAGALGVKYANEPYFVNPVPEKLRLRFVAISLAVLALACMAAPNITVSFTKPNKTKVQATAALSGVDAVTFHAADRLANPTDSKDKAVYGEDDAEYSAAVVNAATAKTAKTFTWLTWLALGLTLAALAVILLNRSRKLAILLLLAALALRLVTWLAASSGLPRAVATGSGTLYLYASLPLLVFAAFFTNFSHMEQLPKKYKLFLMMLPFLLAVFLFSYLPLYGWSYAFYNYKFGVSMDQQEFVGLKWFTEMFTNAANRDNIVRVLKNTFGMSGLNLLTSWMPMIFAVFLNEITRTKFKKFVQIFTTLPNFISWALVFSFAMCLFAADTGIFSKFMMSVGLNDPANPTVWLNSSQHIWLKMWGWSTWKGLGWGAIMYLAAIAGIDQELYEAARVDGANRWALMRHITLPSLLPTFFVLLMLSISNILNNGMEQYLVFQNPMNRQTIEVLDLYVYNITIASGGTALYSYATAIGILKTLVSVTLLFSANFISKKLRGESIM